MEPDSHAEISSLVRALDCLRAKVAAFQADQVPECRNCIADFESIRDERLRDLDSFEREESEFARKAHASELSSSEGSYADGLAALPDHIRALIHFKYALLAEEMPAAVQYFEQAVGGLPFGARFGAAPAAAISCALGDGEAPSPALLEEAAARAECEIRDGALWVRGVALAIGARVRLSAGGADPIPGTVQAIERGAVDVATDDGAVVHVPVLALNLGADALEKCA
jgi:hypothetical protein